MKKYEVTFAGEHQQKKSIRTGNEYSLQEVVMRELSDDPEVKECSVVKIFNQPRLKVGDRIECNLHLDVELYKGRYYNKVDASDVKATIEPEAI